MDRAQIEWGMWGQNCVRCHFKIDRRVSLFPIFFRRMARIRRNRAPERIQQGEVSRNIKAEKGIDWVIVIEERVSGWGVRSALRARDAAALPWRLIRSWNWDLIDRPTRGRLASCNPCIARCQLAN
jgi:hypothetical protein